MKFIIFGIYNLAYQAITIMFLLYANTYLNNFFIPEKFRWDGGEIRKNLTPLAITQTVILSIEAIILLALLHYLNKLYISSFLKENSIANIGFWISIIYSAITVSFIIILMYLSFKS